MTTGNIERKNQVAGCRGNTGGATQLADSAVGFSLDLDLIFLFLSSFPALAARTLSR